MALLNALRHALAKHRPADYQDDLGLGQLLRLFDAVAMTRPEIRKHREAVEKVERLRCTWITRAVREWPTMPDELAALNQACRSMILEVLDRP